MRERGRGRREGGGIETNSEGGGKGWRVLREKEGLGRQRGRRGEVRCVMMGGWWRSERNREISQQISRQKRPQLR